MTVSKLLNRMESIEEEPIGHNSETIPSQSSNEIEDEFVIIKNIIDEVITEVERIVQFKKIHQQKASINNQYKLFDLSEYITDFKVDETIFAYIPFRELLLISKLETIGSDHLLFNSHEQRTHQPPTPVGALCLDVQSVPGRRPSKRFDLTSEQFQRDIEDKFQKIHQVLHTPPIPSEQLDDYVQNEVRMYEESLRREMETDKNKFLVHVSSELDYGGHNGGSRITAWVDRHFHTLEEKRTEYIFNGSTMNEKQIYIVMKKDHYFVTIKDTAQRQVTRKCFTFTKTSKLVGEGANFLLMRYLALTRFIGSFELSTFHINGDLCRNIYECPGPDSGIFNDTKLDICKVYRTIIEECGIEHRSVTVLTLQGQILKQEWNETSYVLQVNPLTRLANERPPDMETAILRNSWEKDMQLVSMFLDSKTENRMHMSGYLHDHPEIMEMIADYVQTILQTEPDYVLDFTLDYFKSFAPVNLARTEHFEPTKSSDPYLFI